ncbi:hypothetical protein MMC21_000976 [Puttea exsequens]|nr:hypothetical protein [Puttea exsequens]
MPPPSELTIATSALNRLIKEESSYRTELASQQKRVAELKSGSSAEEDGENAEFQLRQEQKAIKETEAVFEPLKERIEEARRKVEALLNSGVGSDTAEVEAAKEAERRATARG